MHLSWKAISSSLLLQLVRPFNKRLSLHTTLHSLRILLQIISRSERWVSLPSSMQSSQLFTDNFHRLRVRVPFRPLSHPVRNPSSLCATARISQAHIWLRSLHQSVHPSLDPCHNPIISTLIDRQEYVTSKTLAAKHIYLLRRKTLHLFKNERRYAAKFVRSASGSPCSSRH